MKKIACLAAAFTCLSGCASVAETQNDIAEVSAQVGFEGIYAGTYTCARGENGITVSVDSLTDIEAARSGLAEVSARLWFYDVISNPGHPSGAFNLSGIVDLGKVEMTPGEWISAVPENWGAAGIEGEFVSEDDEIYLKGAPSGPGTSACKSFKLKKLAGL